MFARLMTATTYLGSAPLGNRSGSVQRAVQSVRERVADVLLVSWQFIFGQMHRVVRSRVVKEGGYLEAGVRCTTPDGKRMVSQGKRNRNIGLVNGEFDPMAMSGVIIQEPLTPNYSTASSWRNRSVVNCSRGSRCIT